MPYTENNDLTEAELDEQLEARNAEIRERWLTDPEFRKATQSRYKRCLAQRQADERDPWFKLWRRLNSEADSAELRQAEKDCKRKIDLMLSVAKRERAAITAETADPDDPAAAPPAAEETPTEVERTEEGFGIADEH